MPTRLLEFRSLFKVVIVLLALTGAISVQAQVTTGTVRGEVTDQAGAVVPGATVTITDPKTKTSQTAQSGNGGEYQFNNLPVGTYVITVAPPSDSNFSTLTLNDVRVKLNEVTDVPTVLQPGEATASVTLPLVKGVRRSSYAPIFTTQFNHPQYVPGSVDGVEPIGTTGVSQINTVGQADFDVASHVFSSHPRVIQLALRFDF